MRKFKYWQAQSPDLSLVTNPFGVNQISLAQWLQFIYLPRMRALLHADQGIPVSEILPYAEQVLQQHPGESELLRCIAKLDALTTGAPND